MNRFFGCLFGAILSCPCSLLLLCCVGCAKEKDTRPLPPYATVFNEGDEVVYKANGEKAIVLREVDKTKRYYIILCYYSHMRRSYEAKVHWAEIEKVPEKSTQTAKK